MQAAVAELATCQGSVEALRRQADGACVHEQGLLDKTRQRIAQLSAENDELQLRSDCSRVRACCCTALLLRALDAARTAGC